MEAYEKKCEHKTIHYVTSGFLGHIILCGISVTLFYLLNLHLTAPYGKVCLRLEYGHGLKHTHTCTDENYTNSQTMLALIRFIIFTRHKSNCEEHRCHITKQKFLCEAITSL